MSFVETIEQASRLLSQAGRLSLRALKREFDLDDEALEELADELVEIRRVARREGPALAWIGASAEPPVATVAEPAANEPAPEAPAAERRQLTVLFCDLVDSTRLAAGMDAEDWREVVRGYQQAAAEVIERFGGHVAQYLGDGLLVYFGWPRAHEDDAERAVRAGLGIVDAIAAGDSRLAVRIGIHTGPVVVGEMGGGATRETLAMGDTTNLAARLQGVAEPDTVVMSGATLRLVSGIFVTRDLGEQALKGLPEPVHVHRAERPSGVRSRLDVTAAAELTPFIGRDQELMLLEDRWAQTQEGWGQAVLIVGEAGIGKSRLVQAFRERLAEQAHTWLECRASPYTQDSAFYPVLELQRLGLGFRPGDRAETKLERIEAGLEAVSLDLDEGVPLMAALHGVPLGDPYEESELSPEGRRKRTLELLGEWLLRLGARQPLVLLVEDLHWMDPSTLELIGQILDRIAGTPALLLLTHRPDFEPPWGARSHLTPMLLSRLTRAHLADLIRKAARGRDLPEAWVEEILRRSDGVPLFAEELTRTVLETNPEPPTGGHAPQLQIPDTLQDSLMARLDALGPVKELAQLGAVLGREFSYDLILKVSPMKEAELQRALAVAVDEELFYQRGTPPETSYLFKHALLRDAAYGSLLRATRRRHHYRVGDALIHEMPAVVNSEPELVAHHLTEGGEPARAIVYWLRAGEQAVTRVANKEAIGHLKRGLDLIPLLSAEHKRDRLELQLQVALAPPVIAVEGYASLSVARTYERADELGRMLGEESHLSQVLYGLSAHYASAGQFRKSADVSRRLFAAAERTRERQTLMWGHTASGFSSLYGPSVSRGLDHLQQAISLYEPSADQRLAYTFGQEPGVVARSFCAQALWQLGYPDQALKCSRRAVELGHSSGHPHSLVFGLFFSAFVHQLRRELERVPPVAEEVILLSQQQDFPLWEAVGELFCRWTAVVADPPYGSLEGMTGSFGRLATTGMTLGAPYFAGLLAQANISVGNWSEALGAAHAAFALSAQQESRFWDAEIHRIKAECFLHSDEHSDDEAVEELRSALEIARSQETRSLELRAATSLARLWQRQGKRDEARDLLQPVYDWFTEGFATQDLKDAKALLGELGA